MRVILSCACKYFPVAEEIFAPYRAFVLKGFSPPITTTGCFRQRSSSGCIGMKSPGWAGTVTNSIEHPEREIGLATCAGSKVSSFMGGIRAGLNAVTALGHPSRISVSSGSKAFAPTAALPHCVEEWPPHGSPLVNDLC